MFRHRYSATGHSFLLNRTQKTKGPSSSPQKSRLPIPSLAAHESSRQAPWGFGQTRHPWQRHRGQEGEGRGRNRGGKVGAAGDEEEEEEDTSFVFFPAEWTVTRLQMPANEKGGHRDRTTKSASPFSSLLFPSLSSVLPRPRPLLFHYLSHFLATSNQCFLAHHPLEWPAPRSTGFLPPPPPLTLLGLCPCQMQRPFSVCFGLIMGSLTSHPDQQRHQRLVSLPASESPRRPAEEGRSKRPHWQLKRQHQRPGGTVIETNITDCHYKAVAEDVVEFDLAVNSLDPPQYHDHLKHLPRTRLSFQSRCLLEDLNTLPASQSTNSPDKNPAALVALECCVVGSDLQEQLRSSLVKVILTLSMDVRQGSFSPTNT
eukprot:755748-Hanusia_phi.AAC.8